MIPIDPILELAIAIQQIPAPTFHEAKRAAFVCERFSAEGLADVHLDAVGNVYGRLPGAGMARPLVVSAHLDTVFPAGTNLNVTRTLDRIDGPGIGDNSLGVAGLLGLVWGVRRSAWSVEGGAMGRSGTEHRSSLISSLPGDVWLVANVGEEGLGDLRGMKAIVNRFGSTPRAYIILEGMALGMIYHRALGVKRYRITVSTTGGHSWVDYGRPSAIHELAALVTQLTGLSVPAQPRSSLNVGVIAGGTTINTIAAEAQLELDLRSEDREVLAGLSAQVEALAAAANRLEVRVTAELIGARPVGQIPANHPLVRLAVKAIEDLGIDPKLQIGSTDANFPLSRSLPAICLGLTRGAGAHTMAETILTQPLAQGMAQLVEVVEGAFRAL